MAKRLLTDEQCHEIQYRVRENIWDGWAVDYIGEVAHDFNISKATVRSIIYRRGAYKDLPGWALCTRKSCGRQVRPGETRCESHPVIKIKTA